MCRVYIVIIWLLFNSTLSNSLALQTVASTSDVERVVEMEVFQRVLASCGHVSKRANDTMRGRLWCVSCNTVADKSMARQCILNDFGDLMFSLLSSKFILLV